MRLWVTYNRAADESAPTLVFIHAFPLDSRMWRHQVGHLHGQVHVVTLDLRGYGKSAVTDEAAPFSIPVFAEDVKKSLDLLEIKRAIMVGCSMGGYTLFEFWRRFPDSVAGLVLCDTRADADTEEAKQRRAGQIDRVRKEGLGFMADFVAENLLSDHTRSSNLELVSEVKEWALQVPSSVVTRTLEALASRPDSTATLGTISVPAMIIVGEHDKPTPPEFSEAMSREIKGSRLAVIRNAGHLSPLENPLDVNRALDRFLSRFLPDKDA